MALRSNFSRILRSGRNFRNLGEIWPGKCLQAPCRFHRALARNGNFECLKLTLFKAIIILSHKPRVRLRTQENALAISDKESVGFFSGTQNALLILMRIIVIGSVATGLIIVYLITRVTYTHAFPIILRKGIEFLGPIFIKFGQWASTRKDLFPADICDTLSQLQRTASPHSWIYTKRMLEASYGSTWNSIFVKFEGHEPIGSGCCAQVYKAWIDLDNNVQVMHESRVSTFIEIVEFLKLGSAVAFLERMLGMSDDVQDDGLQSKNLQPVAVKVLHPGIKGQLRRDLTIMKGLCKCATYVVPELHWLNLTDCIDEFSEIMENQVDMNLEAANLIKFSNNFSDKKNVIFPRPFTNFTRREILVESYHDGPPITNYLECNDSRLQGRLAKIGITTILKMIFKDNFIHCDLHPGNILVEINREPRKRFFASLWERINRNYVPGNPRLIILDCGLVVSMSDRCRRNLRDVFRSVLMGDGVLAAEYILEHSSHMTPDSEGFKSTMQDIVNSHLRDKLQLRNVNVSTVVTELFSAMVRHRVKQDGSFSSVILSMVVIEGLGRSLDPNIDVFAEVLPFVFTRTVFDD